MDLWIRSQDKRMLTKIDYLYLEVNDGREILGGNHYMINQSLGIYKSKERALEVLDEIQERIVNLQLVNLEEKGKARADVYKNEYLRCVYEMPKE